MLRFDPSRFVLTLDVLQNLQPLFDNKYEEDVTSLRFDEGFEPDLQTCESLRARYVVSEGN